MRILECFRHDCTIITGISALTCRSDDDVLVSSIKKPAAAAVPKSITLPSRSTTTDARNNTSDPKPAAHPYRQSDNKPNYDIEWLALLLMRTCERMMMMQCLGRMMMMLQWPSVQRRPPMHPLL